MTTEELMKLADAYAAAYMSFSESKARAALEAALSAKQGEQERISELEAMTTDKQQARIDGKVTEQDGCPTELAVLQRFWREARAAITAAEGKV